MIRWILDGHAYMFKFKRKHRLQHVAPFLNNHIFQKHTEGYIIATSLRCVQKLNFSTLKQTWNNRNFSMHALSYIWMELSIQYKYSHSLVQNWNNAPSVHFSASWKEKAQKSKLYIRSIDHLTP